MARKGYRFGVRWIAMNDNAGSKDTAQEIAGYTTTKLLADLFGKHEESVALDISQARFNWKKEKKK